MSIMLPALRGDDPLGFLAATGLLSLSEQGEIPDIRLSWGTDRPLVASADGDFGSVIELGDQLKAAFGRLRERQAALPGLPPDMPLRVEGTKDPMRMSKEQMHGLFQRADDAWLEEGTPWMARWLLALAGQCTAKETERADVELTPFYAPTGRMAMRTSMFDFTMDAVDRCHGPADAITSWRRIHYDGANFDERAKRDAGVTTSGSADNRGAPSPTWLATMGLRLFPMADDGHRVTTVAWQRARLYPGYTTRSMIWPVWRPDLDPPAVRVLLAQSALRLIGPGSDVSVRSPRELRALGVTHVFGSSRRTLQQGDGPLGPARLIWAAARR